MADVDPLLLLAYAVHTSPGVYAVLIGSGVSSAAGVPTGWAITLDLVKKVAALEGQDAGHDPENWHRVRFGGPPEYSNLLNTLGRTPAERQAIIRSYIEPTEDDRKKGLKVPTAAHRALARLATGGYVCIIITTNFDRLIEQALADVGVDFDTVASVDALAGARPVGHAPCLVIKLHGDYRDARILNTAAELAAYPPKIRRLLDRVLDEHGLIVSGWSATWDPALRATMIRQPNRRYTMYWASRSPLTPEAVEVARARAATVIEGVDAETLFTGIADKVEALAELARPHPLTSATAVAELKLYLPDRTKRIRARDLVMAEADRVHDVLTGDTFATVQPTADGLRDAIGRYEASIETLLALFAVGCAWTEDPGPFAEALERVANTTPNWGGNTAVINLRRYPALLCLYAAGLAATYSGRWDVLRALTADATLMHPNGPMPMARALSQWEVLGVGGDPRWLPGQERMYTPASNHIFTAVRDSLRDTIPADARYDQTFDRFEYLLGLIIQDQQNQGFRSGPKAPIGRFGWKHAYYDENLGNTLVASVRAEAEAQGETWPPLAAGLFGGDPGRLKQAFDDYQPIVEWARQQWL
jgi:hypothetical protein